MIQFQGWFKENITEEQYMWYILQGYEIFADDMCVMFKIGNTIHREDGPAVVWHDGEQHWCINDEFHRTDGPAVIRCDKTLGVVYQWHTIQRKRFQ